MKKSAGGTLDEAAILQKNPQVDLERVADMDRYCEGLTKAGIDISAKYRIAPAFGALAPDVAQFVWLRNR